ncbi:putative membrane protein [Parabacteroides sp. PF5-5]|uniref:hypothetical protein n=1 Tax=unclassified Parabacteroides TaxID=2649774 RepID=UPI002475438D|nr:MULTISPECIES: hypothetical protein [unclassified Parabacteroides]MDH6303946.1 putative membrane protein [Parabacteroides sp. PH5-39]MDH6314563.1 putative membrane protein [Parabacteroides sp. PF5-13]MDH6318372.1 putative membrane protein [Parabacteroides sp. PH5-13]MDH6322335.1 putative membrane protein [Parabacteroides sp. PH5-8]MDH6325585.1 putative membrane protein [Parabacteroides sp. PH5-41]
MEAKFTISEVLRTSWDALKSQFWILVGLLLGFTILNLIINLIFAPMATSYTGKILSTLISLIISLIFSLGYFKNLFQALDGDEPQFSAYGQQARKIFTYLIAQILYSLIVFAGFCLLLIPGFYMALRLQFFAGFIIEEDAGIIESLQRSWEITRGQALPLFFILLVMIVITILGIILLGVGIFVAIPLMYMMYCYIFRKLTSPLQSIEEGRI